MKPEEERFIKMFNTASVFTVLSSLLIAMIPLADFQGDMPQKILAYAIGLFFWVFVLTGGTFFFAANKKRKEIASQEDMKTQKKRGIPGLRFFQTEQGANIDVVFLVILICNIILAFIKFDVGWIKSEVVFLLVLSFQMHCILNGENFKYKKYILRRREK